MNKLMASTYIEQLIHHEKVVADLYRICASCFLADAEFWNTLVAHKEWRATALASLRQAVMDDELELIREHVNLKAIEISLEYVRNMEKVLSSKGATMENALDIAWIVEEKSVEKKTFDAFNWDVPGASDAHDTIVSQINTHVQLLAQRRNAARQQGVESWIERMLSLGGLVSLNTITQKIKMIRTHK